MNRHLLVRAIVFPAVLVYLLLTPAFAQRGGATSGGNTGGGITPGGGGVTTPTNPGINTPSRTTVPPINDPNRNPMPEMERPIYISGKVVLEDGTPPPDSITIEKVCNGSPRPVAYTDLKGRFSFEANHPTGMMPDASVSSMNEPGEPGGGFGGQSSRQQMGSRGSFGSDRSLAGCEIRATLPGFRSDAVNLGFHRTFDNPDIGTIILHRLGNVDGSTISMTSLLAPKDAKKALEKGREAIKKNKTEDAEKEFRKAVEAYPKYAAAWFELGRVQVKNQKTEDAMQSFQQALTADPKFISPYLELSQIYVRAGKWQDAAAVTERTIRLDASDFPHIYLFNALANYNLKQVDEAEKSALAGEKIDVQHRVPKLEHLLGVLLSEKGDLEGAAGHLRNYLKYSPNAGDADKVRGQLDQIEKMAATRKDIGPPPQ